MLKILFFILLLTIVGNCLNYININNVHEIGVFLIMVIIIIILQKHNQNVLEFFSAPINHKMGPYSGIKLNPDKYATRRKLIPGDPKLFKNFKNVNSKCGWMKQPCNVPLYEHVNIYNPVGEKELLKDDINTEKLPPVDGQENSRRKMFMFACNQCRPECCPSTYSCDRGCVCTTKQQRQFINSRGHNRSQPNYPYI